jgi:hypothetical protein
MKEFECTILLLLVICGTVVIETIRSGGLSHSPSITVGIVSAEARRGIRVGRHDGSSSEFVRLCHIESTIAFDAVSTGRIEGAGIAMLNNCSSRQWHGPEWERV